MNAHSRVASRALAVAAALTILATHCPRLQAQTAPAAPPSTGPRIGLALSGGGARGIAHVGVLKVLDELRVPISCVTGTSMGAIVGATFAAGRTPAEMEKLVLEANWEEVFRDKPAAWRNRGPPQDRRLQDAVRARVRRQRWRAGAAQGCARRDRDRVGIPLDGDSRIRHHRLPAASDTVPRDRHRHRDGPGSRARQRQPGAGDAREHVGARGDVAGRDRRAAARRRRHLRQSADRPGAQALRRRDHRRQHLDAPIEAQRDHLGVLGRDPASQLSRQADGRRPAQEPHGQGRADRTGPRRRFRGQVRPLEGRHPHRRGGDACARRQAQALQPSAGAVCAGAGTTGGRTEGPRHCRRNPRRGIGEDESRRRARIDRESSQASRSPRKRSAPTCAASSAPAITRASTTGSSAGISGPARW